MMVERMVVLSTAHIQEITAHALDEVSRNHPNDAIRYPWAEWPIVYPKAEYGWFIHIAEPGDLDESKLPDDLVRCMNYAREQSCDWLCFDGDETPVAELPVFNW